MDAKRDTSGRSISHRFSSCYQIDCPSGVFMTEKIVSLDTFLRHETPMIAKPSTLIDDFGNVLKQVKRHL